MNSMKRWLVYFWTHRKTCEPIHLSLVLLLLSLFIASYSGIYFTHYQNQFLVSFTFLSVLWFIIYSFSHPSTRYLSYSFSYFLGFCAKVFYKPWLILFLLSAFLHYSYDYALSKTKKTELAPVESSEEAVKPEELPQVTEVKPQGIYKLLDYEFLLKIIGTGVLLLSIREGVKVRKRIFIQDFINHTEDATLESMSKSLPHQLSSNLSSITTLYKVIDTTRSIKLDSTSSAIDATLSVESIGENIKEAIGSQSTEISIGPVKIPLGSILGLLSKLVQGPRLSTVISTDGNGLVLMASLQGGNLSGRWSVSASDIKETCSDNKTLLDKMTSQLSFRIFTDLSSSGSKRWRAVVSYTEGLRFLRDSIHTPVRQTISLYKAEKKFIETLSIDSDFSICHYNLGYVYRKLGKNESAETAFRKAIHTNPGLTDAYYALALIYKQRHRLKDSEVYCNQIIQINPLESRAWDLKALVLSEVYKEMYTDNRIPEKEYKNYMSKNLIHRELAVSSAWYHVCFSLMKQELDRKLEDIAISCIKDLGYESRSVFVFHQALFLQPSNAEIYEKLGMLLIQKKQWKQALNSFEKAVSLNNKDIYYAYICYCHSRLYQKRKRHQDKRSSIDAFYSTLESASSVSDVAIKLLQESLIFLEETEIAKTLGYIQKIKEISTISDTTLRVEAIEAEFKQIESIMSSLLNSNAIDKAHGSQKIPVDTFILRWASGMLLYHHGRAIYENKKQLAFDFFNRSLDVLGVSHSKEIKELGLYRVTSYIAYILENYSMALFMAEKSLVLSPESAKERTLLGDIYFSLQDYTRADEEYKVSFDLNPSPETLLRRSDIYSELAKEIIDSAQRKELIEKGIQINKEALELVENGSFEVDGLEQLKGRAKLQYRLGRLYFLNKEYDNAITHLNKSIRINPDIYDAKKILSRSYTLAERFDTAEIIYKDMIRSISAKDKEEQNSYSSILFQARLELAYLYIERGYTIDKAKELLSSAQSVYSQQSDDEKALFHNIYGWYLLKESQSQIDTAIEELKKSLNLRFEHIACFHLSHSYYLKSIMETLSESSSEDNNAINVSGPEFLELAKKTFEQAVRLDKYSHFEDKFSYLKQVLGLVSP
jgi:tetratricopeptide (TPR) repeat protein